MYRNSAVVAELAEKYEKEFAALHAVIALDDEFKRLAKGARRFSPAQAILGLLLTRAFNALRAATILLEEGYAIEASMLARAVVEDFINVCYIAYDTRHTPDELAERFAAYEPVVKYEYYSDAKRKGQAVPEDLFGRAKEGRREFAQQYKKPPYTDDKDWSGLPLWKKAQFAQTGQTVPGATGDEQVKQIYDMLNPYLSESIHGGPHVWTQLVIEHDETTTYVSCPHDIESAFKLALPALCFLPPVIVKAAADVFGLTETAERAQEVLGQIQTQLTATVITIP